MHLSKIVKRFISLPYRLFLVCINKCRFGTFGLHSTIQSPLRIDGGRNIKISDHVTIQYKTWLGALPLTGEGSAELVIEEGSVIGNFNHFFATKSIIIHKKVLTADKVFISDNLHDYKDANTPILDQPIVQNGILEVGEGTWLGENVCVLGACIGKHCVIGANSVVTKDIPDYSVAVGIPAKVIKKYNKEKDVWESI